MHHLYKGTAKYYPRKPGERLRAFRRNSDEAYDEQLRNWDAVRKDIKAAAEEAKKKRRKGSNHLSKYEQKNLESSLGGYWEL
jgi:predicted phage gp36 major capsid-like protein